MEEKPSSKEKISKTESASKSSLHNFSNQQPEAKQSSSSISKQKFMRNKHKGSEFFDDFVQNSTKHRRYSINNYNEMEIEESYRNKEEKEKMIPVFVLGVCGPITAGKNFISKYIAKKFFGSNLRIQTINEIMFLDTSQNLNSSESPDMFRRFNYNLYDWKKMENTILQIKKGVPTEFSVYNSKHKLLERKKRFINYCNVLIIEGSYFMNVEAIRNLCDFKLYLDTDFEIVLSRFIYNFLKKEDLTRLLEEYLNVIKPSYELYMVNQARSNADAIMSNFNGYEVKIDDLKKTPMFKMLESYVISISSEISKKDTESLNVKEQSKISLKEPKVKNQD